ncbi:GNAT family N-acetyltransferase [Leifsonia bigeumensis]|uniref:GNAT family N-acetyltransferase n=1 Tax=Leifsonella bigeumensis TaxID=433643 RepID=A0ABP7FNX1_9MICO
MATLHTERLELRPWRRDDVDFVFDLYSRWDVKRYIGREPRVMEDRSEAVALLDRLVSFDDPVQGYWAVERTVAGAGAGQLVGTILVKSIPASGPAEPLEPSGDIEIGWHFHPDSWGMGLASEAAAAVLAHAFAGGLERVVAVTNPLNLASRRVCERIGMSHEGQTDAYYNATCELYVAVGGSR